jgi:cathepsin H
MEAHWNILQKGKNLTFSEQQLVDCAGDFKNKGCNGGLPSQAFEYIRYNGLELGSSYPYVAANRPCKHNVSKNVAYAKYGSYNVTKGNEQELAEKLATKGPISVTFHVTASFRNYAGGVYTVKNCPNTSRDVNHAVLATGYGTEKGLKFWNIKNSWGASWGVKGYFKMERDVNMCGVAQCNAYPLIDAQVHSEPIVGAEEYSWVD